MSKDRQIHIDDKEKAYLSYKGLWSNFAENVLELFSEGEELSIKDLLEKSRSLNSNHKYKASAVNKVLNNELKDVLIKCGKNKWKKKI